jgi:hypothetical protein
MRAECVLRIRIKSEAIRCGSSAPDFARQVASARGGSAEQMTEETAAGQCLEVPMRSSKLYVSVFMDYNVGPEIRAMVEGKRHVILSDSSCGRSCSIDQEPRTQ